MIKTSMKQTVIPMTAIMLLVRLVFRGCTAKTSASLHCWMAATPVNWVHRGAKLPCGPSRSAVLEALQLFRIACQIALAIWQAIRNNCNAAISSPRGVTIVPYSLPDCQGNVAVDVVWRRSRSFTDLSNAEERTPLKSKSASSTYDSVAAWEGSQVNSLHQIPCCVFILIYALFIDIFPSVHQVGPITSCKSRHRCNTHGGLRWFGLLQLSLFFMDQSLTECAKISQSLSLIN